MHFSYPATPVEELEQNIVLIVPPSDRCERDPKERMSRLQLAPQFGLESQPVLCILKRREGIRPFHDCALSHPAAGG
jgi:hypothetical protein